MKNFMRRHKKLFCLVGVLSTFVAATMVTASADSPSTDYRHSRQLGDSSSGGILRLYYHVGSQDWYDDAEIYAAAMPSFRNKFSISYYDFRGVDSDETFTDTKFGYLGDGEESFAALVSKTISGNDYGVGFCSAQIQTGITLDTPTDVYQSLTVTE